MDWSDPGTDIRTPLFNPRLDHWEDHFAWDDFYTHIIGLTPKARATIDLLKMNRPGLVNLRSALLAYGAHPDKGAEK